MGHAAASVDEGYALENRYRKERGRVFITGTQALVRLPLEQRRLDAARGLRTAGFISGYRGSPLGGYDQALHSARRLLAEHHVRFVPGLNEELAATAVMGSQQVEAEGRGRYDGVFGLWYGKGPGVDRAGDAIKHGHAYGTSPHGGVLCVAGDDHGSVSSTMAHQSDQAFAAWWMPVLHPASIADYVELGLWGWAASRFSGGWVGFKAISETVESASSIELDASSSFDEPDDFTPPPGGLHYRWQDPPSAAIEHRLAAKLEAVRAFARANPVDRLLVSAPRARLGIVTVGKAHGDVMEALLDLGFGEAELARLGVRVLKVALTFPLELAGLRRFVDGLEEVIVVEEKRGLVEGQIKEALYALPDERRPRVLGKRSPDGRPFLPETGELRPHKVAPVLAARLEAAFPGLDLRLRLKRVAGAPESAAEKRTPYFCSGCPHSSSTRVPEGSKAFAGIGCHIMATWMPGRETAGITAMGGEGVNWVGLAPFTDTPHMFQNLGDGTYFHSGLLAIRQAVAAKVNITYKILFNDAVAMTGGQKMETGLLTVPVIARQVRDEGVERIAVASDDPGRYVAAELPGGVTIHHRDELDALQRELREVPGVSVLIYDQTCAAEKRRRRKKGELPDPAKRLFINELVCEGCGDCSRASNCLSVAPVETELGTKRRIDQSSCNKDYSCVEGFCPSFVSIEGGRLRKPAAADHPELEARLAGLPEPALAAADRTTNLLVTGVGGTGVLTVGAILGMAAHLEGRAASVLDFTGLAQKGGAVLSHVRIAAPGGSIHQGRVEPGAADAILGCDLVVAAGADALATVANGTTRIVASAEVLPTADLIRDPRWRLDVERLLTRLRRAAGDGAVHALDAQRLASAAIGDAIGANLLLLGHAWQLGLVPVSRRAIERAIELNGVAVEANKRAFAWGRLAAAERAFLAELLGERRRPATDLDEVVAGRRAFLEAYQDAAYADRYVSLVRGAAQAEQAALGPGPLPLAEAVARNLVKLMAYKDEYEVARLYTDGAFARALEGQFEGDYKLKVHLAPPLLGWRRKPDGTPRKVAFGAWILPAMRLLARGKRLRGTALDPFGRTAERRVERRLRDAYMATVEAMLPKLAPHNHAAAVQLAALPDKVRGFGHVKAGAIEAYERERAELLAAFEHAAPLALAAE